METRNVSKYWPKVYNIETPLISVTAIAPRIHRFSSDHRSEPRSRQASTWMGDRLGIPGAVIFFFLSQYHIYIIYKYIMSIMYQWVKRLCNNRYLHLRKTPTDLSMIDLQTSNLWSHVSFSYPWRKTVDAWGLMNTREHRDNTRWWIYIHDGSETSDCTRCHSHSHLAILFKNITKNGRADIN